MAHNHPHAHVTYINGGLGWDDAMKRGDSGVQFVYRGRICILDEIRFEFTKHFQERLQERTPHGTRTHEQQMGSLRALLASGNFAILASQDMRSGRIIIPITRKTKPKANSESVFKTKSAIIPFVCGGVGHTHSNTYMAVIDLMTIYANDEIIERDCDVVDKFTAEHGSWAFHGFFTGKKTIWGGTVLGPGIWIHRSLIQAWWMYCAQSTWFVPELILGRM
jgi:hypothetical protein